MELIGFLEMLRISEPKQYDIVVKDDKIILELYKIPGKVGAYDIFLYWAKQVMNKEKNKND